MISKTFTSLVLAQESRDIGFLEIHGSALIALPLTENSSGVVDQESPFKMPIHTRGGQVCAHKSHGELEGQKGRGGASPLPSDAAEYNSKHLYKPPFSAGPPSWETWGGSPTLVARRRGMRGAKLRGNATVGKFTWPWLRDTGHVEEETSHGAPRLESKRS